MILDEPGSHFLPTCGTINTGWALQQRARPRAQIKVGTLTLVTEVLRGSLPVPVLERPDECAVAGDFVGNLTKFVDNEP